MPRQTKRYDISPYASLPSLFDDSDLIGSGIEEIDRPGLPSQPMLRFMSFGSGSSGNCAFLTDGTTGLLIDAGVDPDHVERSLARNGYSLDHVKGILLTHDHGDHVRFVYRLVRSRRHIKVYCTPKAFNGIMRRHSIARRLKEYYQAIYKEFPFSLGAWQITAFEVSHDGTDNAGYFIANGNHRVAIATDLGCITDRVRHYMEQAQSIVIEANYDAAMLAGGRYPEFLKARIAADNGHLDNRVTASFVASLASRSDQLRRVFLCHLSHDNNTPAIALSTIGDALCAADPRIDLVRDDTIPSDDPGRRTLLLDTLPRFDASMLYTFRL